MTQFLTPPNAKVPNTAYVSLKYCIAFLRAYLANYNQGKHFKNSPQSIGGIQNNCQKKFGKFFVTSEPRVNFWKNEGKSPLSRTFQK